VFTTAQHSRKNADFSTVDVVYFYPGKNKKWLGIYVQYFTRFYDYFPEFYVAEREHT
jgi:hypothetical protein